jgi:tetratricopeptide (TPR) repeat protein
VDSWSSLGGILQGLGRNQEAIVAYERAIALQPRDRNSRHNRWSLLLGEGRKEVVAEEASLAIEREPGDGEAHWASVMARYGAASPPVLIAALERALRLAPDDPTLALELAIRLNEQGEAERAEALYRQVWAGGKAQGKTAFYLGRLLVKQRRWSEARPIVEAELRAGRSAELLLLLSEIRFMTGDRKGALESAREVVRLTPDRADAWRTLADLEADQGQLEAAAASYRRAIELGHDDPSTRERLAALHQRMGSSPETGAREHRRP